MNIVVFASDAKGLSSLNGVINELASRDINLFAVISNDTQLRYPLYHKDRFQVLSNCEVINSVYSQTLGVDLPFKPDWLIVSRERWNPETDIMREFKHKLGAKIALVEPNSWILGNGEVLLEIYSRNRFKSLIDVFFLSSTHSKELHDIGGFEGNIEIVGNPKYDLNLKKEINPEIKEHYNIDSNKKQVLLFSLINSNRDNLNSLFKDYIKKHPEYQFFYKPYPGEPFDPKFNHEFNPKFFLDNCTPIIEENHIWDMFNICDIHVGVISSIFHGSLLLKKELIDFSRELGLEERYENLKYTLEGNGGIENNVSMWMNSFGFTTPEPLYELLSDTRQKQVKTFNKKVLENLGNSKNLLKLFDDYNDYNSSNRIVNYILNEI